MEDAGRLVGRRGCRECPSRWQRQPRSPERRGPVGLGESVLIGLLSGGLPVGWADRRPTALRDVGALPRTTSGPRCGLRRGVPRHETARSAAGQRVVVRERTATLMVLPVGVAVLLAVARARQLWPVAVLPVAVVPCLPAKTPRPRPRPRPRPLRRRAQVLATT